MVAANLHVAEGKFLTSSGRSVALQVMVDPENADRCEHALESLKRAMRWDEEVYGLEYDLERYMIVGTLRDRPDFDLTKNVSGAKCVLFAR
jgi:aminopeptidase N